LREPWLFLVLGPFYPLFWFVSAWLSSFAITMNVA